MNQELKELLSSIKTTEDRNRLLSEISLVSDAIYKTGEIEKVLSSQVSKKLQEFIGRELDQEKLMEKVSNLKKSLDELTVVKLTLAYEPTESNIESVTTFVRQKLGEQNILEIKFEPKILGGAIIEFNGLYRDFTLKTKLEEVFKKKGKDLLAVNNYEF